MYKRKYDRVDPPSKRFKSMVEELPPAVILSTNFDNLIHAIAHENKQFYTKQQVITIIKKIMNSKREECSYIS